MRLIPVLSCLALGAAASSGAIAAGAPRAPLPRATPRSEGLSGARLRHMSEFFKIAAARHEAPGYVMLVARHGKLVFSSAAGYRNIERREPMTLDTRFRIASMTKPVTCVAVLMLYEEGRFHLDDPVARFLPEFAHSRVFTGIDAAGNVTTEPAKRPITIRDLLTQQSGLGYAAGFDTVTPLAKAYAALKLDPHATLAESVRRIAAMPLYFQPGEGWRYSYADDVLGRLVEVVSGMPFAKFLNERLFTPLGMKSTGFYIPESARSSLATPYRRDGDGELEPSRLPWAGWLLDPTDPTVSPSGGAGLISTAGDYLRFAQMLADGGSFDGREYLSPVTVDLMTHNQVPPDAMEKYWGADSVGLGYGLGVGVEIDARHAPQAGFNGDYAWGGILDTHWLASPKTGIVAVLMTQIDPVGGQASGRTDTDFRNLLFAAVGSALRGSSGK